MNDKVVCQEKEKKRYVSILYNANVCVNIYAMSICQLEYRWNIDQKENYGGLRIYKQGHKKKLENEKRTNKEMEGEVL